MAHKGLVALGTLTIATLVLGAAVLGGLVHGLHLEVAELQERFDAIQQHQSGGLYLRCVNGETGPQCAWILPPLEADAGG